MKRSLLIFLATALLGACAARTPVLAPHRTLNDDHKRATNETCLDCHDLGNLKGHRAGDNCTRCHRLSVR
ncbi:MAG: hypothetical protein C0608_00960 [Deltaproteobacteria bacterium]|nr:MAG: hypothetical protein C0608_00960 [Deltaproteobacteria bacterium]